MKIGDEEYKDAFDKWVWEEYQKDPQKPNAMRGLFGWYAKKENEFVEKLREENRIDD